MDGLERRYERYAAKWLAETERYEPPRYRETTDENLAEVLSHQWITIPAKAEEYPAIREAIEKLKEELCRLGMDDIEKVAAKLNDNMTHAVMRAYKGSIQCDVPKTTQNALVKRGLAFWPPNEDMCADLTELGVQVLEYLLNKRAAEERARDEARAVEFAAEQKIYEQAYAAGQSQMLAYCVSELLQAVYPGDPHPDRPNDTIFKTLVENIRTYLAGRRVTISQVEAVTEAFHDQTKATVFYEQPYARQRDLVESMRKAMVDRAGIRVVSAKTFAEGA